MVGARAAFGLAICVALLGCGDGREAHHAPGRLLVVIGWDYDEPAGELVVVREDGSGLRRLTSMSVLTAAWSPDGRRIAFVAATNSSPVSSVWVVGADGGRPRRVVRERHGYIGSISWTRDGKRVRLHGPGPSYSLPSPDGARIAFTRGPDLWVKDADGRHEHLVLKPTGGDVVSLVRWQP